MDGLRPRDYLIAKKAVIADLNKGYSGKNFTENFLGWHADNIPKGNTSNLRHVLYHIFDPSVGSFVGNNRHEAFKQTNKDLYDWFESFQGRNMDTVLNTELPCSKTQKTIGAVIKELILENMPSEIQENLKHDDAEDVDFYRYFTEEQVTFFRNKGGMKNVMKDIKYNYLEPKEWITLFKEVDNNYLNTLPTEHLGVLINAIGWAHRINFQEFYNATKQFKTPFEELDVFLLDQLVRQLIGHPKYKEMLFAGFKKYSKEEFNEIIDKYRSEYQIDVVGLIEELNTIDELN